MIKEITKYTNSEEGWRNFTTAEEAKEDARDSILRKFLMNGNPDAADQICSAQWQPGWRASTRQKFADAQTNGYDSGYRSARYRMIRDFLKFYPEIMASLKKIDEQKIEVK